ncbi:MAG TPA: DUF1109 domain-containing protein [Polyangia bacterium]|nr:DUF1109 domain-containing protein [Polyangia bacterium]
MSAVERESGALEKARAAALAELRRAPVARPWTRRAAILGAAWGGLCALIALGALAAGSAAPTSLATLAALLALAAVASVAAVAPGTRWASVILVAAPVTMGLLALARGEGIPSSTPGWVCSVSHVGVGLLPLGWAIWALGDAAWRWPRALAAGLGAGTAGAFVGELACHQGARHVLIHHVGAWLFVAGACVAISRYRRPRSFAP